MEVRVCNYCKESKPIEDFLPKKPTRCRVCYNTYMREWSRRNKETVNARVLKHYYLNRDAKIATRKEWYKNNFDRHHATVKKWKLENPEKALILTRRGNQTRRLRMKSNTVFKISTKETKRLYSKPCFYCGNVGQIELDHVVPIARGGSHGIGNLVPACKSCNASKGAQLLIEWKLNSARG